MLEELGVVRTFKRVLVELSKVRLELIWRKALYLVWLAKRFLTRLLHSVLEFGSKVALRLLLLLFGERLA